MHWPREVGDLGVGGVSYLELLILCEKWAGENAVPFGRRAGRPISVLAVPFGPGIDIWRSRCFLGSIFRFLAGCLVDWLGSCLAVSVLIIVGCGMFAGRSVGMVLLLVQERRQILPS